MPDRFAVPRVDAKEVQLDVSMRIDETLNKPWRGAAHRETELFGEFAFERIARSFSGLELAAGKFPVPRIGLAGWTLRNEHPAVRPRDDGRGDQDDRAGHVPRDFLVRAAAPA